MSNRRDARDPAVVFCRHGNRTPKRFLKENIKKACLDKFQDSMDRLFEQFNTESVRKTMLMHEEIFKEQVRELHRLYRVQKMLMDGLRNKEPKLHQLVDQSHQATRGGPDFTEMDNRTGFWSPGTSSQNNHSSFGNWHHQAATNSGHILHRHYSVRADPSSQEHSGSCSADALRIPRGFDLERPAEEDLSTDASAIEDQARPSFLRPSKDKMSINSSHDPRFYPDEEREIELTLSIGCGSTITKSRKHHPHTSIDLGCSGSTHDEIRQSNPSMAIRLDREENHADPTKNTAPATFNRESLQQPPWLFHSLSLNRT
ncbi:hypothetical protein NE237_024911 [Protea cynaroides]|uniref:Uncharacterized protein n=1 Tax=Protea cynaroides TaxID=273540 RepID=A0A9Q0K0V1_9MAGN|nr:hypothetical protein NE237_024911 [Protea cynaroides]